MSSKEKLDLVKQSKSLADRQNAIPDKDVLPKLELNDVPKNVDFPKTKKLTTWLFSHLYQQPTNGLTHNLVPKELVEVESQDELDSLMILLSALLGKVAAGNKDHIQLQKEISKISGGISAPNHFFYDKNEELKAKTHLYQRIFT